VASTRASSETGSCSAEDAERDMQSLDQVICSSSSPIDALVEKMNVMSTSPAFHPVPAAADICVPVPSAEDATPVNQTVEIGTEVVSADSLKCWLAGVAKHDISGEDLAERLRAAMPETYED